MSQWTGCRVCADGHVAVATHLLRAILLSCNVQLGRRVLVSCPQPHFSVRHTSSYELTLSEQMLCKLHADDARVHTTAPSLAMVEVTCYLCQGHGNLTKTYCVVCMHVAPQGGGERQFNGLVDVYRKTISTDGIAGLYRGFTISCVGIIVYRGLYFGMYDSIKPVLLTGDLAVSAGGC